MVGFEDNAVEILKASLRKVTLIDDDAVVPFDWDTTKKGFGLCKSLSESFSKENAVVDFIPYTDEFVLEKVLQSRTDLIVLDWELASSGDKFTPALRIIQGIAQSECPHFMCVYTSEPEAKFPTILIQIKAFLAGYVYDPDSSKPIASWIDEQGGKSDEFLNAFNSISREYLLDIVQIETFRKNIFLALKDGQGINPKDCGAFMRLFWGLDNQAFMTLWYTVDKKWFPCVSSIDVENACLIVNDTIVILKQKEVLKPGDFVVGFTQAMSRIPHCFLTFLNIEYRNELLKQSAFLWKKLQEIDEKAFLYHLSDEEVDKSSFLSELWKNDITSFLWSFRSQLMPRMNEYLDSRKITFSDGRGQLEWLVRLNCYYNLNPALKSEGAGCQFGDVFVITHKSSDLSKYVLCVSPHCDCLRPEKIKHRFLFVESNSVIKWSPSGVFETLSAMDDECSEGGGSEDDTQLKVWEIVEHADSHHMSFLDGRDGIELVHWKTNAPYTIHIDYEKNRDLGKSNEFAISIDGEEWTIRYHSTLKENYAQRMANHALSYANRIGITFAKPVPAREATESPMVEDSGNVKK